MHIDGYGLQAESHYVQATRALNASHNRDTSLRIHLGSERHEARRSGPDSAEALRFSLSRACPYLAVARPPSGKVDSQSQGLNAGAWEQLLPQGPEVVRGAQR